jgi:D-glycero-D-manno-heptose 1,7-bisphosphate phosphatase
MNTQNGNQRAVFLDRDGTVSEEIGYMYDVSFYRVFPWTGKAIRKINNTGRRVVLATNQSGIERGYFTERMVHRVHKRLRDEIGRDGARLDNAYFCPHHPESDCPCRKPLPGMLYKGQQELGIDLGDSYMVGDRYSDVRTGKTAGTRTILVMTGDGRKERGQYQDEEIQPDLFAEDLAEAAEFIRKER